MVKVYRLYVTTRHHGGYIYGFLQRKVLHAQYPDDEVPADLIEQVAELANRYGVPIEVDRPDGHSTTFPRNFQ